MTVTPLFTTEQGLELELEVRTEDRVGLLSEITRVFRENSLSIIRAAITTKDGKAEDTFYVSDTYGNPVDGRTIDAATTHPPRPRPRAARCPSWAACSRARSRASGSSDPTHKP
jgi:hypothetical protein